MKEFFKPEMEIIHFDEKDVIAASEKCYNPYGCICHEDAVRCGGNYDCKSYYCPNDY